MASGTPNTEHDIRTATLVDLPTLRRLAEHATILDCELGCTRESVGVHDLLMTSRFWGAHTLIGRVNRQQVIGQYRCKPHEHLAQMVFVAPYLEEGADNTAWLHVIDAITADAGRRGATMLTAEVEETSALFTTMRAAGFAVYARQELWRGAIPFPDRVTPAKLTRETSDDTFDIQVLYSNIVPRLVQPFGVPSTDSEGYVYRDPDSGRVRAYVAVSEGKYGVYLMPYLHPDIGYRDAAAILAGAVLSDARAASRAERAPVYVSVRRYQDWLESALEEMGFEVVGQQAVMVRHIAAGIRHAYTSLTQAFETNAALHVPHIAPHSTPGVNPSGKIQRVSRIGRLGDFTSRRWNVV